MVLAVIVTLITFVFWTSRTTIGSSVAEIHSNFDLPIIGPSKSSSDRRPPKQLTTYFEQVFSKDAPPQYDFAAIKRQCQNTKWRTDEEIYFKAVNIQAGMTTIMSQVKVALKMALDAGVGILLPEIYLRSSQNLLSYTEETSKMPFREWFEVEHLVDSLKRACPQMKVLTQDQIADGSHVIKNNWDIDLGRAVGFTMFNPLFWRGNPYQKFFDAQFSELKKKSELQEFLTKVEENSGLKPPSETKVPKDGITVITQVAAFLVYRITDDPTGEDLEVWNDLGRLVRFKQGTRDLTDLLLSHIDGPFYGVHFRAEKDGWTSPENQMVTDLDLLDQAWEKYGSPEKQKPVVYLACGDEKQVEMFVKGGLERGWTVTHKWTVAQNFPETITAINNLPFDFQGAVDMGVMLKSDFYIGMVGSAFSSTIGNARDSTGRYRGSSLVYEDGGARTHLDHDLGNNYPCCL